MIHIGEHALLDVLEQHQRISRGQCLCGAELWDGLPQHLLEMVGKAVQE